MAVYTRVSSEEIAAFLERYDVGSLVSAKGIAEGVENSNYLIETTKDRFILTLYEKRVDPADLPFFIDLLDHLAAKGCSVPPMIADRDGGKIQQLCGRSACLITFLSGISVTHPTPTQSHAAGKALGEMHGALEDFDRSRPNSLSHDGWRKLAESCGDDRLGAISAGFSKTVRSELGFLDSNWPDHLPQSVIHADLFPDNVLMLDDQVTGLIDFYFSCTDIRAYDLAITHTAWSFSEDGSSFLSDVSDALISGYSESFGLNEEERKALPVLCRGAALRFSLSRAYDWVNTPAGALVTRKDPAAFLARLQYYQDHPEIFSA